MLRPLLLTPVLFAAAMAFPGSGTGPGRASPASAQDGPSLHVDSCIEVESGEQFTLDISARDLPSILAWELYFTYDRQILEVEGKDVRIFLAEAPNSNVFDFSDPVPSTRGLYRIAAADLGGRSSAETGSGVLARLTLRAHAEGVSAASIAALDVNHDQVPDLGPSLTGVDGTQMSDVDGDSIFDGLAVNGQVAVGLPCSADPPDPPIEDLVDVVIIRPDVSPTVSGGDGSSAAPASPSRSAPSGSAEPTQTPGGRPAASPVSVSSGRGGGSGDVPGWFYAFVAGAGLIVGASIVTIVRSARRSM